MEYTSTELKVNFKTSMVEFCNLVREEGLIVVSDENRSCKKFENRNFISIPECNRDYIYEYYTL